MSEPTDLSNVPLRTSDPETGKGYIACPHDHGVCHHACDTAFGPCYRKENGMNLSDASCRHCAHPLNMHAQGGGYCSLCACKGFGRPSELGPDAITVANAAGGKQSDLHFRFDLMDPDAMFALAGILDHGERKYGERNWGKIPTNSHLNHALVHIYAYLAGNKEDDHLGHAFCRLMMAIGVDPDRDHIMPVVEEVTIGGKEESGSEDL